MLCFSVFGLYSRWVLLSSETLHLHNSHRFILLLWSQGKLKTMLMHLFFLGGGGWAGDNTAVMKVSEEFAAYVSSYTLEWE